MEDNAVAGPGSREDDWRAAARERQQHNDIHGAIDALEKVMRSVPDDWRTATWLGSLYAKTKQYDRGIGMLGAVLELAEDQAAPMLVLAELYSGTGAHDKVLQCLQSAYRNDEANAETAFCLAKAYQKAGRHAEATELFRKLQTHGEGNVREKALRELANSCMREADLPQAARVLESLKSETASQFLQNKIINLEEFAQKKTVLSSRPYRLLVSLTNRCNLQCIMCNVYGNWDIPSRTVDEIIGMLPNIEVLHYLGGESLLSPHFERLFTRAAEYPQLHQVICTNGLLINEKWARIFARSAVRIDFSIDGTAASSYEKIRARGRFDVLCRNLALLKEEYARSPRKQMTLNLNFIIMRSNYRDLAKLVEFAARYGIKTVGITLLNDFICPAEVFREENIENDPAVLEYLNAIVPELERQAGAAGITLINFRIIRKEINSEIQQGLNDAGRRARNCRPAEGGSADRGQHPEKERSQEPEPSGASGMLSFNLCHFPWSGMRIADYGRVTSVCASVNPFCTNKAFEIGSVESHSLSELWNCARMQDYRKRFLAGENLDFCNRECFRSLPEVL